MEFLPTSTVVTYCVNKPLKIGITLVRMWLKQTTVYIISIFSGCLGNIHHLLAGLPQQPCRAAHCWQSIRGPLSLQPTSVPHDHVALSHLEHRPGQCLCETSQQVPQEWRARSQHGGVGPTTCFRYIQIVGACCIRPCSQYEEKKMRDACLMQHSNARIDSISIAASLMQC